ncbi:MAG: hypothetical protein P1S60_14600 [Anaerolineae bacterium]|nr:hypothetical protein [Anaerolineae bacterium]
MAENEQTAESLLKQGITAIKNKDKLRAKDLLQKAIAFEPDNANLWFWLTAALEDPFEQEESLLKVIELDPSNELAQNGLLVTRKRIIQTAYDKGVQAVAAGDHATAVEHLMKVVERDESNLSVWRLLYQVVETSEDQEVCLNNILILDPSDKEARSQLDTLVQNHNTTSENHWSEEVTASEEPDTFIAPTLAGDILGEAYKVKHTTQVPDIGLELNPVSVDLWTTYEDELRCPYCVSPTTEKHRRCPECGKRLWTSSQMHESRSLLLWILILLQASSTIMLAAVPLLILFIVAQPLGIFNFFNLFPAYLGLPSPLNERIVAAAFDIFPRFLFFLSMVPALISLLYTIALYLRWTPVYYFLLIYAFLGLAGSIASLAGIAVFDGSLFAGIIGIVFSLGTLIMVIKLESDFRMKRRRLYLRLDSGLSEEMSYLLRGKHYARLGMWGLAAIHFHRALGLMAYEPDIYLATVVALTHVHDYPLAYAVLENALQQDPDNERIQKAMEVISAGLREEDEKTDSESLGPEIEAPIRNVDSETEPVLSKLEGDQAHEAVSSLEESENDVSEPRIHLDTAEKAHQPENPEITQNEGAVDQ